MVLEVATGQVVLDQKIRGSGVNTLAFHPDCKRLAVGGTDAIELWDIARKEKLHDLPGHESWVYSVAFTPTGSNSSAAAGIAPSGSGTSRPGRKFSTSSPCGERARRGLQTATEMGRLVRRR